MPIFQIPNTLKSKSIKPVERTKPQPKAADSSPADLERLAMEAMADLSAKFPAWVSGDIQKIKQLLTEASGIFGKERTEFIHSNIYPKVHDLKGQGSTFGYPLITDIGSHMCQLLTSKDSFSSDDLVVLKNDTKMMETVVWKKLKGDGGAKGAAILEKLK